MQESTQTAPVAQEIALDALAPAPAPVAVPAPAPVPVPAPAAALPEIPAMPAPVAQTPQAMPIENPPTLAPTLNAQEKEVMYGALRNKIKDSATMVGGGLGAVGGAIIGGIWSAVAKGKGWMLKTGGALVALGAIGAIVSRITWGKDEADKAVTNLEQQISALPPEQQAAAYEEIRGHLGVNTNAPKTSIAAETAQLQSTQSMQPAHQMGA